MVVDDELLAAARASQARAAESERAVELARAEFRYRVRKLHQAGASLRQIGDALNLSHQRVHQLVDEAQGWHSSTARGDRAKPGQLACSFCGKTQKQVRKLTAGPGYVFICEACVDKAGQALATGATAATPLCSIEPVPRPVEVDIPMDPAALATCSFCGKDRYHVAGLAIAAGTTTASVTICDECLALCREIIADA